jgi:hypothetical protein
VELSKLTLHSGEEHKKGTAAAPQSSTGPRMAQCGTAKVSLPERWGVVLPATLVKAKTLCNVK